GEPPAGPGRGLHRRAEVLPGLGADLVRDPGRGGRAAPRAHRRPFPRPVSGQRGGLQHAGVRQGVWLQGGGPHGAEAPLPRVVGGSMRSLVRVLALTLAVPAWAGAAPPAGWKIPVEVKKLANGLTVVVSEDHSAPTFGMSTVYRIGFRLEPRGRTGFAHLFEH